MVEKRNPWRPSLYSPKDSRCRIQGILSLEGWKMFEKIRTMLAKRHNVTEVSHADSVEWLVRDYTAKHPEK